jgi:hypothetical protein
MPRPAVYLHFAREFGGWPEDYRRKPADEILYWTDLLGIEAEVDRDWSDGEEGVEDHVYFE